MAADEVKEVLGFLRHSNPAVQQEACKVLTQLCSARSAVTALSKLNVTPVLLPLISAPPPLPSLSLTLLVLLSSHDEFTSQILSQPTVTACMETVRSLSHPSSSPSLPLVLQLLVNLSRSEVGAKQLMQDGTAVESLHMRRLLSLFLLPPSLPSDPYQHIASLLLNVSPLPSGRRWLLSPSSAALQSLPPFILSSSSPVRQRDVLTLFRNLCLEQQSQQLMLAPGCALLENCLLLIAGHGEVREEERDGFFPSVLASMSAAHPRHPDAAIRRLVLEIIVLLARYKPSRAVLKQRRVYTVLRELHMKHEKDEAAGGDRQLDELLYDIVPYFILPEEEEAKGSSSATVEELKEGEVQEPEEKDAAVNERTALLLDELTQASQAVQPEIDSRRAAQQAVAREKAEHDEQVQQQMELRERVDDSVERDDDDDDDENELPELIEEAPTVAAADLDGDVMERMD